MPWNCFILLAQRRDVSVSLEVWGRGGEGEGWWWWGGGGLSLTMATQSPTGRLAASRWVAMLVILLFHGAYLLRIPMAHVGSYLHYAPQT